VVKSVSVKKPVKQFKITNEPRSTIEVHLSDGRIIVGPREATIAEFFGNIKNWDSIPIVGAVVNGNLRELTYRLKNDSSVKPVDMSSSDGSKIYRRSLTFLLEMVFQGLFPDEFLAIDHSVPNGGYYCKIIGETKLSINDIAKIKEKMIEYVQKDLPIIREKISLEEAIRYFKDKSYDDKLRLLKYRKKDYLILYKLEKHKDYHHGYMVPSTGYLKIFDILPRGDGFILQYPRRKTPQILFPMPKYNKLIDTFRQYGSWLKSLDIDSVAALNDAVIAGSIPEVILVSEALHEQKIAQIAEKIAKRSQTVRIILIAGPTSSGKTTFSKRLAIQLLTHGISPFALEMDNYFIDREKTPLDEFGKPNFEAFEAINSELLDEHLSNLLAGKEIQLPRFNFKVGRSEKGERVRIGDNQVILIEGIHGLNPKLLGEIDSENTFRIYTSCLTQLNLDHFNRISTTDTRMLRRIIRDASHRGYTAQKTIEMWESVRRGEREYIFPYQENADEIFNSALVYELAVIKKYVEPLLRQVPFGTDEHMEAKRLLAFLDWFLPIDSELIPDNSILREFVGGSILRDFHLWKN